MKKLKDRADVGTRNNYPTSFRLSPLALDLLERVSSMHGLTATAWMEMTIRKEASQNNLLSRPRKSD